MGDNHYTKWLDKIRRFHLVWFMLLGGLAVLSYAWGVGWEIARQSTEQLREAKSLSLQVARMSITREIIPVQTGLTAACITPLLGLFAHFKVRRSLLENLDQEKILMYSRLHSLWIVTPFLAVGGILLALSGAYFATEHRDLSHLFSFNDFYESMCRIILMVLALSALSVAEIKLFFKEAQVTRRIMVCCSSIVINTVTVYTSDLVAGRLFSAS